VYARHPELFLDPAVLARALSTLGESELVIALRGGEPSRHPRLDELVAIARPFARTLHVETHARWVVDATAESARLIDAIVTYGATMKISFDAMHGMRASMLREVTRRLDAAGAAWVVAITEPDEAEFARARAACEWIADDRIIFQRKVTAHHLLVSPRLGTIGVMGHRDVRPTTRQAFRVVEHAG